MIFDHIEHSEKYESLVGGFKMAFEYLRNFDRRTPPGKIILAGDRVHAIPQEYTTSLAADRDWEAHRRYADIQFMVEGEELIYCSPRLALVSKKSYDAIGDYELFRGPDIQYIHLRPGYFGVFMPQEAHKPGCSVHAAKTVKKVVMKVLVE